MEAGIVSFRFGRFVTGGVEEIAEFVLDKESCLLGNDVLVLSADSASRPNRCCSVNTISGDSPRHLVQSRS